MEMEKKWDETEEGGVDAQEKEIATIAIECTDVNGVWLEMYRY